MAAVQGGRLARQVVRCLSGVGSSATSPHVEGCRLLHGSAHSQAPEAGGETDRPTASFGYREVPEEDKSRLVGHVFSSVAGKYDIMNDIMSGGLHRLWKDRLVERIHPFPGMHHLDVAGGTGDVAFKVLRAIRQAESSLQRHAGRSYGSGSSESDSSGYGARVIVCDINAAMLEVGRQRATAKGLGGDPALEWVQGDAENLAPIVDDASVDAYSIAFGLRNVTRIDAALSEAYRVLRRGGQFTCLEFSHVPDPLLRRLYDAYSFSLIPLMGSLVAGDTASYQYLVESIRMFPRQEELAAMMREAGFERVTYENMTGGIVALHSGFKL